MKRAYCIQIASLIFLTSCQNNKLAEDILKMQSQPIDLSSCEEAVCYKKGEIAAYNSRDSTYKLVVYLDSMSCSPCFITHMYEYEETIDEFNSADIRTVVVFEPKQKQKEEVEFLLEQQSYSFLTVVVNSNAFSGDNPHLPTSSLLHSFLLNLKNEVVIVGNPFRNTQIKELMLSSVKKMKQ